MIRLFLIAVMLLIAVEIPLRQPVAAQSGDEWTTSTPEEQGMHSGPLADALARIREEGHNIHSVLVLRNGNLVAEAYAYPYGPDTLHDQRSATKSNISTLIGIAIDEGSIESVDQPLLSFFPDRKIRFRDERKETITLRDVLTMTSGLSATDDNLMAMVMSPDWVRFMLDALMIQTPGTTFAYSSGGSHLLSAILQVATGEMPADYAREKLYGPLGITSFEWQTDPQGLNVGGFGLFMRPRDMAKLGTLYLNNGAWQDRVQIVSETWVSDSTRPQAPMDEASDSDYGYQWWMWRDQDPYHGFHAAGYGGQYIYVCPDLDMVVVFTSGLETDAIIKDLLYNYILPAAVSTEPQPPNLDDNARLAAEIDALAHPQPGDIPPLPEAATTVSGQSFAFRFQPIFSGWQRFDWDALTLDFTDGSGEALLTLLIDGQDVAMPVGLDGVPRATETPGFGQVALLGEWTDATHFSIMLRITGLPEKWTLALHPDDDRLQVMFIEHLSGFATTLFGKLEE